LGEYAPDESFPEHIKTEHDAYKQSECGQFAGAGVTGEIATYGLSVGQLERG
jgi:hypothetical protein